MSKQYRAREKRKRRKRYMKRQRNKLREILSNRKPKSS